MKKHTIINLDEVNFDNLLSKLSNKNSGHHVNLSSELKELKRQEVNHQIAPNQLEQKVVQCSSSKCRNCGCGRNKPTKR